MGSGVVLTSDLPDRTCVVSVKKKSFLKRGVTTFYRLIMSL